MYRKAKEMKLYANLDVSEETKNSESLTPQSFRCAQRFKIGCAVALPSRLPPHG